MRRISMVSSWLSWPLLALLGAGVAEAQDPIVPIEVRQSRDGAFNMGFVDVTVCNTAKQCKTVADVLVDTGSSGLRLNRHALAGLPLSAVTDVKGRPLSNWSSFGTGQLWGTMHWAQVRLGGVATTQAIPIQLYQGPSLFELLPAGYEKVDERHQFLGLNNGILGIAPYRHWPKRYFAFDAGDESAFDAEWVAVEVDESRQLANPIAYFPAPYDNGSVIKMPEADFGDGGHAALGWLGLGIGAATEALFPQGARIISHELDAHGRFPATIGGRRADVLVDSGTNTSALDLEHLEIPRCKGLGTELNRVYDAAPMTPLSLTVSAGAVEVELQRPLYIGAAANIRKAFDGYAVLPMIAALPPWAGAPNVLGLPFFYGRTVATGLRGAVNPYHGVVPPGLPSVAVDSQHSLNLDSARSSLDARSMTSLDLDADEEPIGESIEAQSDDHPTVGVAGDGSAGIPGASIGHAAVAEGFEPYSNSPHGFIVYTD